MAGKVTAPSASIFTSDPLEQIAMKGVLDRDISGLSFMFLNALGQGRERNQEAYMSGLTQSNQQAGQIAEMEARQKQQEQFLKAAIDLVKNGDLPSSMPVLSQVFGAGKDMDQGTRLNQELTRSKITANNRDPSGGDGIQVSADVGPAGSGFTTIKGKGPKSQDLVNEAVRRQLELNKNRGAAADPGAAEALARRKYGQGIPQ
ncbi:MAG: hypothetical protein JW384_03031 [Nitrosomonadaceae bacterium]|nr:hypothetical protein [Nitrosomonadaceae bacterium]